MARRPRRTYVLIDWNSELHAIRARSASESVDAARRALKSVCRQVGKQLLQLAPEENFFLFLRAYHGWRRGFESTPNRVALEAARVFDPNGAEGGGLNEYSAHPRQVVVREMEFGDRLLGARDERLCGQRRDHHLPSTLQTDRAGTSGEKMVDTALVSDLLYLAAENDDSWLIVVGQDADLVPGILTAEGLLHGTDRRVVYLARGGLKNSNPTMVDLVWKRMN